MIISITFLVSIACNIGNVDPNDPELQPPISVFGLVFEDFLRWLKLAPSGFIMAPWITYPADYAYNTGQNIEVIGWAEYYIDAEVVIYQVLPNNDLSEVNQVLNRLSSTQVNKETKKWSVNLELPEEKQFIAARLERESGISKYFSNIIYISTGDRVALTINAPQINEIVSSDTVSIEGTGEPGLGLEVYVNGENVKMETQILPTGHWVISDVPLIISGFDKDSPTAEFKLTVKAEATNQEETVSIQRMEPISLVWPYGEGEGENYNPIPSISEVTAFFGNDWHLYERNDPHYAIDIASRNTDGEQIHAISAGTVVAAGWRCHEGGYVIIDSGGFGVLYLHLMEKPGDKDFPMKVGKGDPIVVGQIIGTEGYTSKERDNCSNFPRHLHLQVFIWNPNDNKDDLDFNYECEKIFDKSDEYTLECKPPKNNSNYSSFYYFYYREGININPPTSSGTHFSDYNINLYDYWGGSPYCAKEGCWNNRYWDEVNPNKTVPLKYDTGTYEDLLELKENEIKDDLWGLSTRLRCLIEHEGTCP
jgi:murein DD-endopeptidase MepM/ murein hydrolase activator NlpD